MEQKRKVINGTTYLVNQMPGTAALKAQARLVGLLGKGIFEVFGKIDLKKAKSGEVTDEILEALSPILDNFDDEKAYTFVLSLFDSGVFIEKVDGDQKVPWSIDFDKDFAGKPKELWKVVAFILEANFATGK